MKPNFTPFIFIATLFLSFQTFSQNILVTTNNDSGSGSLRDAILAANARLGPDTILFNIPGQGETEAGIIPLISPLPEITDHGLVIMGVSTDTFQLDERIPLPDIAITGYSIMDDAPVGLRIKSNGVHINHILIIGFKGGGIEFNGVMEGSVSGCYIGLQEDDGEDKRNLGSGQGISIESSSNVIIGPFEIIPFGNIISGYGHNGVAILDSSSFNAIAGNYIGINPGGVKHFNDGNKACGVFISEGSHHNEIIDNHIGLNHIDGIRITHSEQNIVFNNFIGTDDEFMRIEGNQGSGILLLDSARSNEIVQNHIGYNQEYGIFNEGQGSIHNRFSRNFISKNSMGGIINSGGGNFQIPNPVLETFQMQTVFGKTGAHEVVEIFFDEGGQGQFYADSTVADENGDFRLVIEELPGELNITATTTDLHGNTSGFSEPLKPTPQSMIITVTNTQGRGDETLHAAIDLANARIGPDTILFNIPKSDPCYDDNKGIWTIKPDTLFSSITDGGLVIDGLSQSQFIGEETNPSGPEIVINGEDLITSGDCFKISAEEVKIYSLTINNFKESGIAIYPPGFATISGCYIGTNYNGMESAGNQDGIVLEYQTENNFIGPSEDCPFINVISGNSRAGIFGFEASMYNTIFSNYIGVNCLRSMTLGNTSNGIKFQGCDHNEIFGNFIGGNNAGITLITSEDNIIANNFIGTDETGQTDLGNTSSGIYIWMESIRNRIKENRIGYGSDFGIFNDGPDCVRNLFSRNSFHNNGLMEIYNRDGANLGLDPPSVDSLRNNLVKGHGEPGHIIELYADWGNEGIVYLDSALTDDSGDFIIILRDPLPDQAYLLALERDASGNTSEFSVPYLITSVYHNDHTASPQLYQNCPNPVYTKTHIYYKVNKAAHLKVEFLDSRGTVLEELINGFHVPGNYTYELDVKDLPTGQYYYSLWQDQKLIHTRKIIVH